MVINTFKIINSNKQNKFAFQNNIIIKDVIIRIVNK